MKHFPRVLLIKLLSNPPYHSNHLHNLTGTQYILPIVYIAIPHMI